LERQTVNTLRPVQAVEVAFEVAGVIVMLLGALLACAAAVAAIIRRQPGSLAYVTLRQRLGGAILLGLEFLVAADIIRSVALDPTFTSVGVLALLVVVRTFLSWSLEVEIEGRWPWSRPAAPSSKDI
jgi:uncharacterized membrane protein